MALILFIACVLVGLAAAGELQSTVAPLFKPAGEIIPGHYIVKLKDGVSLTASEALSEHASSAQNVYGNIFRGFATSLDEDQLAFLRLSPSVEFIEHDMTLKPLSYVDQPNAGWNLGRISHRKPGNSTYTYDSSAGAGTCSYILDTGIAANHPVRTLLSPLFTIALLTATSSPQEFGGRAAQIKSFVSQTTDGNGHGTHIAGIIGGTVHGVAKHTRLYGVKVLDDNGSGTLAHVIGGMDYIAQDAKRRGCPRGAMANLSIGGAYSRAVNAAAAALVRAGVFVAVAAGGNNGDAGGTSPASEPTVCTVGASTERDARAPFSDYGPVVDVFAPGVSIRAAWPSGDTQTLSGTAMAAAHITGLGAYLAGLEGFPGSEALCKRIQELATKNILTGVPSGTVNLLAFNGNPLG
ncbi:subtilisin-like protease Pr1B [Akanthomyces lecanii RCEF 1005]|uniref:Subtilisin-like protease Pr1B n=1 Tax=Akanthomyces lecanii RCEF 1005 TaxID=1081108 RepID=A0A168I8S3_CORDF|nr:subtilisin-like protease Pr1B [Akanthomyces lecanii RCEF 1005]